MFSSDGLKKQVRLLSITSSDVHQGHRSRKQGEKKKKVAAVCKVSMGEVSLEIVYLISQGVPMPWLCYRQRRR